jgi:CubicO group peptidase (beta-lactamase class C family)
LRLTDPVVKHVPEIARVQNATADAPPISLLQLATMTSGLAREPGCSNHSVGPVSGWVQKVLDCLPETRYQHPPGTQYLYSNIGYATLGIAIERAAGRSFVDVVSTGIFRPLGMTRSAFEPTPDIRRDLAHGYQRNRNTGQASRTIPDQKLDGRGYRVPNGASFSTVNDLAKFLAWELGEGPDSLLDRRTQEANYTRVYTATVPDNGQLVGAGYGVGFMLSRRGDILMLGHGGSTEGYHAAALFHRATKLGVVVLRGCDTCAFDASPVASRVLERAVVAAREMVRENRE